MRIGKTSGIIFLLLLLSTLVKATEIKFTAPDYAGDNFSFYVTPNFLTEKKEFIGEGTVDENGNFSCIIEIESEVTVYSEFDVFKGWLIVTPGEVHDIVLPKKTPKRSSNPYFKLRANHLGLKGATPENTNVLIAKFNRQYTQLVSKNMQEIFHRRSLDAAEALIAELETAYPTTENEYFENFKRFKYASVKHLALIQEPEQVMEEYFIGQPILYSHPEYATLFDKLFRDYLKYATQEVTGQKISVMLNSGAFEQLIDWLTLDMMFDKPIAEAIILKGVKPLFYSKRFNTVGLFNILQKIAETSELPEHKETADNIFNELARTMYGTIAPELDLIDIAGNFVGWEDFEGTYVYLCFTRTDNEKFAPHKELMRQFQQKYDGDLEIVVVIEDDAIEENEDLLYSDDFYWTVLRGSTRKEIYDDFNVRILPTYFLIDPQGRMAGSQAPWPDENFEMQFANILKATR